MIYFVVALLSEARPLISYYRLKLIPDSAPFKIYEASDKRLIVSGVGKIQAASATAFLHTFSGSVRNEVWINIGIGGHAERSVGAGILAHKITDQATNESWYPPIVIKTPCPTEAVLTVERPETQYQGSWVYEMEAAAFYSAATRFSTSELVQCYKVISDNPKSSTKKVSAAFVESLIAGHLKNIDTILGELTKLVPTQFSGRPDNWACAGKLAPLDILPPEFQKFLNRWHFTVSEQYRLHRLLRRLKTLTSQEIVWSDELQTLRRARDVLKVLEQRINLLPVTL